MGNSGVACGPDPMSCNADDGSVCRCTDVHLQGLACGCYKWIDASDSQSPSVLCASAAPLHCTALLEGSRLRWAFHPSCLALHHHAIHMHTKKKATSLHTSCSLCRGLALGGPSALPWSPSQAQQTCALVPFADDLQGARACAFAHVWCMRGSRNRRSVRSNANCMYACARSKLCPEAQAPRRAEPVHAV